jgi:hypothetical protein
MPSTLGAHPRSPALRRQRSPGQVQHPGHAGGGWQGLVCHSHARREAQSKPLLSPQLLRGGEPAPADGTQPDEQRPGLSVCLYVGQLDPVVVLSATWPTLRSACGCVRVPCRLSVCLCPAYPAVNISVNLLSLSTLPACPAATALPIFPACWSVLWSLSATTLPACPCRSG